MVPPSTDARNEVPQKTNDSQTAPDLSILARGTFGPQEKKPKQGQPN
jgi:hypothetical protein